MKKRTSYKENTLFELIHTAYNHFDQDSDPRLKKSLFQAAKDLLNGKYEEKVIEELAPQILRFYTKDPNDDYIGALNAYLQKRTQRYKGISSLLLNLSRIFR